MRARMDAASEQMKLNFSLIATPAEGLSGRFVKIDRQRFGVIPGITDRDYYTNSFHIPVYYDINAFEKIRLESPYHAFSYTHLDVYKRQYHISHPAFCQARFICFYFNKLKSCPTQESMV